MLQEIWSRLESRHPRILVVGDLMVDHYLLGNCQRISPEAPVPVVELQDETFSPGGAGNVMANLRALGAEVVAASVVGDDEEGRRLLNLLQARLVKTDLIQVAAGRPTSRKTRVMAGHHQLVRLDRESRVPLAQEIAGRLVAGIAAQVSPLDAVVLSDYHKGVLTETVCRSVIQWARRQGLPVLVDPKGCDGGKYHGATVITPNRKEAAELAGVPVDSEAAISQVGRMLRESLGIENVLITLSEAGMALAGEQLIRIPAEAREVYDVTGAGDTVIATLAFALGCGIAVETAAQLANCAAAVAVGKPGCVAVTLDEIRAYRRQHYLQEASQGLLPIESVAEVARQLRSRGKRIVFTNGCFDLLHRGHVEYLQASRACGDVLIVGLNSDDSVRRLKGPSRPIMNQQDRSYVLAALGSVDYVVVFDEDTPYELIRRIRPDVLTKGADYRLEQIAGREFAGEVRLISLVEGRSTTQTIHTIRQAA